MISRQVYSPMLAEMSSITLKRKESVPVPVGTLLGDKLFVSSRPVIHDLIKPANSSNPVNEG
jgi:hypothetical protein